VVTIPQRRQIRGLVATNVKFFGSEARKTLEPLSSGDGKHAVNPTGARDPL
jgi:hypothetical protein